jgi:hypothetical protein
MGEKENICRLLVGKLERKDYFEDLSIHGKMILKWIVKR